MSDFANFHENRDRLLSAYQTLRKENLVPVDSISLETLVERESSLCESRFVIAACGQMNSGKSTLLNALVLRRPVLPMAATVMTAKITLLEYAEEEGFEVECYSTDEWQQLLVGYSQSPEAKAAFEADVGRSSRQGQTASAWISSVPRCEKFRGYDMLQRFVGVEGSCTPYVKMVHVRHTNPLYRDVVVADTPGVNDPNALRERITREWVQKADAVVYVSYAGQAGLTEPDVAFISTHLLHVQGEHLVLAANKIDMVSDLAAVEAFLRRLRNHERQAVRTVFAAGHPTSFVCAGGGLIDRMRRDGTPFTPALEELAELLGPKGYLDPKEHRLETFETLVGERLMRNKGASVLQSHSAFIEGVFRHHELHIKREQETIDQRAALVAKDARQLAFELREAEKAQRVLVGTLGRLHGNFDDAKGALLETSRRDIGNTFADIENAAQKALHSVRNTSHFENEVAWILKNQLEVHAVALHAIGESLQKSTKAMLDTQLDQIRQDLDGAAAVPKEGIKTLIAFSMLAYIEPLIGSIGETFNASRVHQMVVESTNFLQRWFNTTGGREDVRSKLKDQIYNEFGRIRKSVFDGLENAIVKRSDEAVRKVEEGINELIETRIALVQTLQTKREGGEKERINISEESARLSVRRSHLDTVRACIGDLS